MFIMLPYVFQDVGVDRRCGHVFPAKLSESHPELSARPFLFP